VIYSFDLAGHLRGISDNSAAVTPATPPGGSTVSYAASYAYDSLNRPTSVTWSPAPTAATPAARAVTLSHAYNKANQRIGQTATDNSWWYYPPATPSTVSYTANTLNQYTAVGAISPTYSGNGNLTSDGTFTDGYDTENRLTSVTQGGTAVATYAFDAQGRRKLKTVGATTTVYVADADNREVMEYNGASGQFLRWNTYGLGSNDVLNQMNIAAASRATLIPDIQGSMLAALDSSSGALNKTGYLPYGRSASIPASFGYTGQRADPETNGLYYFRARMYMPAWGRFMQPDPIGYNAGSHLYAYVGNDPLNNTDPAGLWGGPIGSGSAEGGLINGAGASASVGGGVFWGGSQGLNIGGFASGGAFVGGSDISASAPAPLPGGTTGAIGAYAGVGSGFFITNATTVGELKGPFNTYSINTPIGSLQLGVSGSTWIFSATCGVPPCGIGVGAAASTYPTNTVVAPDVPGPTSSAQPVPTNVIPASAVVAPTSSGAPSGASYGGLGGGTQSLPSK
jgi:RHS repeat-associated protein